MKFDRLVLGTIILAMISSISVPVNSSVYCILEFCHTYLPFIRKEQISDFFCIYNIVGASVLVLLLVLICYFICKIHFTLNKFTLMIAGWLILQFIYCVYFDVYSSKILLPIVLFLLFLYFQTTIYSHHKFNSWVVKLGVVNSIITLLQFIYCGFAYGNFTSLRIYRPPGIMPDATLSAIFMSIALAFVLFNNSNMLTVVRVSSLLILGCIANGSRNAVVLIICAILIFILRNNFIKKVWICILGTVIITCIIFLIGDWQENVLSIVNAFLHDNTRNARIQIAMKLFALNPILGVGLHEYGKVAAGYGFNSTVHNIYAMILCNYGIIGFLLFFIPYISALVHSLCRGQRFEACILIMLGVSASVVGIEVCVPLQIIWYYIYSIVFISKHYETSGGNNLA